MKRRKRDELIPSLFPFLSVLACVIGTLTLLLAALTLERMSGQSLEQAWLVDRYEALQESLATARVELARQHEQIREIERQERDGEVLGRRLAGLGLSPDISLEELAGIVRLSGQARALAEQRGQLEAQKRELAAAMGEREVELDSRRALQRRAPIVIEPSGLGREQQPYIVECTADYLELHRISDDWSFRIPKNEILGEGDFRVFLRRVRAIRNGIVIFLIRPEAVATYRFAAEAADRQNVRHAKLPLPGSGELDLGLF